MWGFSTTRGVIIIGDPSARFWRGPLVGDEECRRSMLPHTHEARAPASARRTIMIRRTAREYA